MDQPIVLNEQFVGNKFENISNVDTGKINTLDQPIIETIKRDVFTIYEKVVITLSGSGNYEKIRKEWDLWGPLMISLITACICAFSTAGSSEQTFINIFLGLWIGPLIITVNANLLGAKVPIVQSLCLIIYCSAPMLLLAVVVLFFNMVIRSFIINFILAVGATVFTLRCSDSYFRSLVPGDKSLLSLYPVLLFYTFMSIIIAMT